MAEWVVPGFVAGGIGAGIYLLKTYMNGGKCKTAARLDGKTVIITGANTGIGKEAACDLARRGARVILACRDLDRANAAADNIAKTLKGSCDLVVKKLDLASFQSVRHFAEETIKDEEAIHILINNAGVMFCPLSKTEDGFEMQFGVNHLGHFLLTNLLLEKLKKSAPSRVVTVSSMGYAYGRIEFDNLNAEKNYVPHEAYCRSKLANVYFTKELDKRLEGTNVTANAVHPGAVRTELARHITWLNKPVIRTLTLPIGWLFTKSPWQGAQTTIYAAVSPDLDNVSGKYFSDCCEKELDQCAQDKQVQAKLWDVSMEMVGLMTSDSNIKDS